MSRLSWNILLLSLAAVAHSNPLVPRSHDTVNIDRYNPIRRVMDALCLGFETSFCKGNTSPAMVNHILPEVHDVVQAPVLLQSPADEQRSHRPTPPERYHPYVSPQTSWTTGISSIVAHSNQISKPVHQSRTAALPVTTPETVFPGCSIRLACNATTTQR